MASDRLTDWESRRALLVVLAAFFAWAFWFIFRNSFVFDETRYFVLKDDAMISMTYARNFANGFGLNWARWGQPVEGFTHPLWALLMVPIHWLPISLAKTGLGVQLASAALLGANLVALQSLVWKHFGAEGHRHWLPAAVLTAAYYPLNYWALLGMETGLQALLTTLSVSLALSIAHDGSQRFTTLFALLATAALVRMDMLLMVIAVLGYVAVFRAHKEWGRWVPGAAIFVALCGGYELFRWLYFGDWLPNTYYLKMTGVPAALRIERGALVTLDFLRPIALPLCLILLASLALGLTRSRKPLLPCGLVVGYLAYAIYVGGDAWRLEKVAGNRFVAFTFPLFFALSNAVANRLLAWLDGRRAESRLRTAALLCAMTLGFALLFNGFFAEGVQSETFRRRWREVVEVSPSGLARDIRARVLAQTLALGNLLEPDAMVAVLWAGIPAYYSDYRMTDLLGYNDRHIARGPSAISLTSQDPLAFVPGHNKWDAHYTLGKLRPDLVFQLWSMSEEHLARVMKRYGYEKRQYWVRRDSSYLR